MANRVKMIKFILFSIIDRTFFANFTWGGKGSNGQKKEPLKTYPNVLKLIYAVVKGCDKSYSYDIFLENLKSGVIRHAYAYGSFCNFYQIGI